MSTTATQEKVLAVWDGRLRLNVTVRGSGPPLVYFHPAAGLMWDAFLNSLAERYTVHAPEFPGTSVADRNAVHAVDDLWDVVLCYEQAMRLLNLERPVAIGQSFGGMVAAELAAAYPQLFSRLVLLDPIGLWLDDTPVWNWMTAPPSELPGRLFYDPQGEAAAAMLSLPEDPEAAIAVQAGLAWNLGATGKFVWPIPDKGLTKRLHRIEAPTLVIWGEDDALVSVAYAEEFGRRITGSRVETVPKCGHIPQVEQLDWTLSTVTDFLDS